MAKASILIVEDERTIAQGLWETLKNLGYEPSGIASSGARAIQKAADLRPDLVLMDVVLKGEMDGIEAAEEIRTRLGIPSIFINACGDEEILKRARLTEPYGYILKPFEARGLHASIQMALHKHQMEQKLRQAEQALRKANEELEQRVEERAVDPLSANARLRQELSDRRRAEEELQQVASHLAILNEIGWQVATHLDLDQVAERAAHLVQEHFGLQYVGLFIKASGEDRLVVSARAGERLLPQREHSMARGQGMAGWSDLRGESPLANTVDTAPGRLDLYPDSLPICSELRIPIRIGDEVAGVLDLQSAQSGTFDPSTVTALERLADQLAVVINNARRYSQAAQRNRELSLLNRVMAATAAGETLESTLQAVCRELALAFELPRVDVALFNTEKTAATVVAEHLASGCSPALGESVQVMDNAAYRDLLTHKRPLAIEQAQTDPRLASARGLLRRQGIVSLLLMPLVVDDETVGSLEMDALEPRAFSAQDINLAWRVAELVSNVLLQVRLREEHRQMEQQFYQARKMEAVGRLAGGIAHDFNNLLTVIQLGARVLEWKLDPGSPALAHLQPIRDAAERATGLTRQLLAFSRSEVVKSKVLDLNQVLGDLDDMLRHLIGEGIELTMRLSDDLWPIEIDPTRIEQVIVNLAANARDAMPGGGKLGIDTANVVLDDAFAARHLEVQPGKYVMLTVTDSGIGMSDEVKACVFEPFFTTKEKGKATGLGLSSVFGIVKQNRGHIDIHSQVDSGTCIKIYLPRVACRAHAPLHHFSADTVTSRGSESLLLVEDNAVLRELAESLLTAEGYKVLTAQDGVEALQVAQDYEGPIDLLLTDVVMPRLGGRALADQLRLTRPKVKVLFISGYADDVVLHSGMPDQDIHFLPKPFDVDILTRKVRHVLDSAA